MQGMSNCNPLVNPVTVNENFLKANNSVQLSDKTSYRGLIESLLFHAKQTLPNIFVVSLFYLDSW